MALALDQVRMIPSLPYKLDKIIDFGLFVMMAIWEAIKELILSCPKNVQRHMQLSNSSEKM